LSSEKQVLVFAEQREGQLDGITFEVLGYARQLAGEFGSDVHAAVIGTVSREMAATLASYGADRVYFLDSQSLPEYSAELDTAALLQLVTAESPEILLCGATLLGHDLMSRLAARLETGLIADCTSLSINTEGRLLGTKLTHGGRVSSTIVCNAGRPQMATLKPGAVKAAKPDTARQTEITVIKPELSQDEARTKLIGIVRAEPDKISLDEAEVIIAVGKGIGSRENLALLEEIARYTGGVVAASLGAIDEGWLPHKKLVGQTGTTVTPGLYVACGISGSVYHVLGMRDSEFVIAINKDRNAPIFKVADMSIIGDAAEVAKAIIERLRQAAGKPAIKDERASKDG
jgi:electron transfer flavoprotein alpha subunit